MTNDFTFAHREEGFDNHIEMSIRGYNNLHEDVVHLSRYFVEDGRFVIDIGSSTGKTIEAMVKQNYEFSPKAMYVGIECASGFEKNMEDRVAKLSKEYPKGDFIFDYSDVRDGYDYHGVSLVTSLFTLQFMPLSDREEVIQKVYNSLNSGGAFIFAEKVMANDARTQQMLTFNYYDYKRKNFTEKDIMDKERTLRNMLKPNTWSEIESMLRNVGFKSVQPFWQNHLFVGAIAIKE
jgi:tRNA (cmo5U34)-methyltransferase